MGRLSLMGLLFAAIFVSVSVTAEVPVVLSGTVPPGTTSEDSDVTGVTDAVTTSTATTTTGEVALPVVPTGCAGAGLCCQGKNNTCRASGRKLNSIQKDGVDEMKSSGTTGGGSSVQEQLKKMNDETCFCDSSCLILGDCCTDYQDTCAPVDCELAEEWSDWSECSVRCGTGIKQRVREIIKQPLNGGKECPRRRVEKAACEGTKCKLTRADGQEALRETGKIIPATFGEWRKNKAYNPYEDIRKNLYEHYGNHAAFYGPSYCMEFEITDVRRMCSKLSKDPNTWTSLLVRGAKVCVECQALAMKRQLGGRCRGHGVLEKATRWSAIAAVHGCRGKWVMKSRQDGCQCPTDSPLSFILV